MISMKFERQGDKLLCGLCFPWAFKRVQEYGGTLVHGIVTSPLSDPPHEYSHAWLELGGKVFDWQTMEAGHGGKYNGKGWPVKTFYKVFQPKNLSKYDQDEAVVKLLKEKHYGPWDKLEPNMLPQDDIEQLIQTVALRLSYEEQTPEEIRSFLMSRGLTSDEAFLVFKAAQDLIRSQ